MDQQVLDIETGPEDLGLRRMTSDEYDKLVEEDKKKQRADKFATEEALLLAARERKLATSEGQAEEFDSIPLQRRELEEMRNWDFDTPETRIDTPKTQNCKSGQCLVSGGRRRKTHRKRHSKRKTYKKHHKISRKYKKKTSKRSTKRCRK